MSCNCNRHCAGSTNDLEGNDILITSNDPNHPANLICELCRLFYDNGWCTGTGGGISIRQGEKIFIAPSGVQKERMKPSDMFVMDLKSKDYLRRPESYKPSACTPLFHDIYTARDSGACIHTHSQNSVMCSLLYDKEFRISNIEQIKAIPKITEPGYLENFETLVIPIVENVPHEEDLSETLQKTLREYPSSTAVIVRRHGIFVWGPTIWKAKIFNEAIDYLLELAVKMKQFGIPTELSVGEEKKYVQPKVYN